MSNQERQELGALSKEELDAQGNELGLPFPQNMDKERLINFIISRRKDSDRRGEYLDSLKLAPIEMLIKALGDDDDEVRRSSKELLLEYGEDIIEPILNYGGSSWRVKNEAVELFKLLGNGAFNHLIKILGEEMNINLHRMVEWYLIELGPLAKPHLQRLLASSKAKKDHKDIAKNLLEKIDQKVYPAMEVVRPDTSSLSIFSRGMLWLIDHFPRRKAWGFIFLLYWLTYSGFVAFSQDKAQFSWVKVVFLPALPFVIIVGAISSVFLVYFIFSFIKDIFQGNISLSSDAWSAYIYKCPRCHTQVSQASSMCPGCGVRLV